jgi:branched-chain amino acid transport system ATP-binding protein
MPISAPSADLLAMTDVEAGYGEVPVLRGIDLHVRQGLITTLIGANGAGKSTVLRTVFGTIRPTRGDITYRGQPITDVPSSTRLRSGITYCPQGRCNFPMMTVQENLEMGAYVRTDPGVRGDIEELLALFPLLRQYRSELAGNLSGGQQQILEMAMALMPRPSLLMIDEPSLGLSPIMLKQVFDYVVEINRAGVTVLMVEQNARQALAISHYGVALELGQVLLEDTGGAILANEEIRRRYLGRARETRTPRGQEKGDERVTQP